MSIRLYMLRIQFINKFNSISEWLNEIREGFKMTLHSEFMDIVDLLENRNTITESIELETWLYKLNQILDQCSLRAVKSVEKKTNTIGNLNPFTLVSIATTRKELADIKKYLLNYMGNDAPSSSSAPSPIDHLLDEPDDSNHTLCGFDQQLQSIQDMILGIGNKDFKAIGIVGGSGSGKTTLTHMFFRSPITVDEFELRIWVTLSVKIKVVDEELKKNIVAKMLTKLQDFDNVQHQEQDLNLTMLLDRLHNLLSNKKYLIVLDNLWHFDSWFVDGLPAALPKANGSAIIVTTVNPEVAGMLVGEDNLHYMQPLSDNDIWSIIVDEVVKDQLINPNHPKLLEMKDELIEDCRAFPLFAKTVANSISLCIQKSIFGTNMFPEFYIPKYILLRHTKFDLSIDPTVSPLMVFVNPKDDMRLGGDVLYTMKELINENQVFDIVEDFPEKVLRILYTAFEKLIRNGDFLASETRSRLRVLVVGNDSTVNWMLRVINDMKLYHPPCIAVIPLGTNFNISNSLGWGNRIQGATQPFVQPLLQEVVLAKEINIDSWHVMMKARRPSWTRETIKSLADPSVMQPDEVRIERGSAFTVLHPVDLTTLESSITYVGGFWNSFVMRLEASEDFNGGFFHDGMSRNISKLIKLKIMLKDGQWQDLPIPHGIKSIACLNMPNFMGKENIWGTPNPMKHKNRGYTPSFVDDGIFEIVVFKEALLGLAFLPLVGRGIRLGQATGVRFEFVTGAVDDIFFNLDGKQWRRQLHFNDDTVYIEISYSGHMKMLATPVAKILQHMKMLATPVAKILQDPSSPRDGEEIQDSAKDWKTYGVAKTFTNDEDVDS